MSSPALASTFLRFSRSAGSPLGAFHRSNAALIVTAVMIHTTTLAVVWLGDEAALAVALAAEVLVIGLIGAVAAAGTIRHQTRAARLRGGWDELLVTPLTDREIVNGQLLLAMRPFVALLWLALPSPVILMVLIGWSLLITMPTGEALEAVAVMILVVAGSLIAMALLILLLCIGSLQRAFTPRRHLGQHFAGLLRYLFAVGVIALFTVFLFPLAWMILVALAWIQHRTLCCTVRARLLAER